MVQIAYQMLQKSIKNHYIRQLSKHLHSLVKTLVSEKNFWQLITGFSGCVA